MKRVVVLSLLFAVIFGVVAGAADMQTAIREANKKLQANHFLLDDEIDELLEGEQTPNVLGKLTEAQQKAIVEELNAAKTRAARESETFGLGITDELERSIYQAGVFNNKMLKARREIAARYGIKAGDIFTVEVHVMFPD